MFEQSESIFDHMLYFHILQNARSSLLFCIEAKCMQYCNRLIREGVNIVRHWARYGSEIISNINEECFGVSPIDLTLVCLFIE